MNKYKSQTFKPPQVMTAHKVESLTDSRRIEERRLNDLLKYAKESQILTMAAKSEEQACQNLLQRHNKTKTSSSNDGHFNSDDKSQLHGESSSRNIRTQIKKEKETHEEMERQKMAEKELIEREIQRICDTSEELRELEKKLKIAYINKERAAQYQEALLLKKIEAAREQEINEKMEVDRQNFIQNEMEKEVIRRQNLVSQKVKLQEQMLEHEYEVEKAKQEALKDRDMIDKILAKINEEDRNEAFLKQQKSEETRSLIRQYQKEREDYKLSIAREEMEQNKEIQSYNDMVRKRNEDEMKMKEEKENDKKRMWAQVANDITNRNQTKDDYDMLRNVLWEQELEEKAKKEEEELIAQRMKFKEETFRQNIEQIQAKKNRIAQMEEEERLLVQKMLNKFASDDEAEWERQRAASDAKREFMAAARRQRDERVRMFQEEKMREQKESTMGAENEEFRQRVIREARKKLLEKHAAELRGFLPKGTIINEEEADLVGTKVNKTHGVER